MALASQPSQVFISYQRTDGDYAVRIREHLVSLGVRTWMDQYDIPVGAYWPDAIDDGLTGSDIVVGILSPDAMVSRNVKNEWDWAIQNDKRLLLVQVKPTVIPHRYVSINFIDATGPDSSSAFAALLSSLGVQTPVEQDAALPETRYARSGDVNIAYQLMGDGPLDLVLVPGFISNIEVELEWREWAQFYRRLTSFGRLIRFDKRGTGLSDRVADAPPLDLRMDDVRAVMDAAGSERAVLLGWSEGGPMSVLFAATYPERTIALILWGAMVKGTASPGYPWAPSADENEAEDERFLRHWGTEESVLVAAPGTADDKAFTRWFARFLRLSASPSGAVAIGRMNADIDVRHILPSIRVPTLVMHRTGDHMVNVGEGRYLAQHIPGARYVEFPGDNHLVFIGDHEAFFSEIASFLARAQATVDVEAVLATILALDVEVSDSTGHTSQVESIVQREFAAFRGREIHRQANVIVATFDGPSRAVRCAVAIRDAATMHGVTLRTALHTGEVEVRGDAVDGHPLRLAVQLTRLAVPGEIVLTSTVKNLVAGSGIQFKGRDSNVLIDLPDECHIFAVD